MILTELILNAKCILLILEKYVSISEINNVKNKHVFLKQTNYSSYIFFDVIYIHKITKNII